MVRPSLTRKNTSSFQKMQTDEGYEPRDSLAEAESHLATGR